VPGDIINRQSPIAAHSNYLILISLLRGTADMVGTAVGLVRLK